MSHPSNDDAPAAARRDFIRDMVAEDVASNRFGRRIATRFPPEPNGFPHIGHLKAIALNFGIAREFGGTCNLRFDDTNPTTEDVKYVEALIGPQTINTLPDETIAAFRDHGRVAPTLEQGLPEERAVIERLAKLGIDIDRVTDELVVEGVDKFVKPFDELQAALAAKRQAALANKTPAHRS